MGERQRLAATKALSVLKRKDPAVKAILRSSPHVVAYQLGYGSEPTKWSRLDVEGPLHVVERDTHPHYTLVVLNRKGMEYLTDPLVEGQLEIDVADRFMMYRMNGNLVHGIWFYETADCQSIANLIVGISRNDPPPTAPTLSSPSPSPVSQSPGPSASPTDSLERFFPGLSQGFMVGPSPARSPAANSQTPSASRLSPPPSDLEHTNRAGNFIMGLIGAGPTSSAPTPNSQVEASMSAKIPKASGNFSGSKSLSTPSEESTPKQNDSAGTRHDDRGVLRTQSSIEGIATGIAELRRSQGHNRVSRADFIAAVERASADRSFMENIYQCYLRTAR